MSKVSGRPEPKRGAAVCASTRRSHYSLAVASLLSLSVSNDLQDRWVSLFHWYSRSFVPVKSEGDKKTKRRDNHDEESEYGVQLQMLEELWELAKKRQVQQCHAYVGYVTLGTPATHGFLRGLHQAAALTTSSLDTKHTYLVGAHSSW